MTGARVRAVLAPLERSFEEWTAQPETAINSALEEAAQRAHREAIRAFNDGEVSAAGAILAGMQRLTHTFYRDNPRSRHALLNDYGTVLAEQGDFSRADALFNAALSAAANCGDDAVGLTLKTLTTYMGLLSTMGDLDRALKCTNHALLHRRKATLDPVSDAKLAAAIGAVLLRAGRVGEAERALSSIPEQAPDPATAADFSRAWSLLAQSYTDRRLYRSALLAHAKARALVSSHPEQSHALADAVAALAGTYFRMSDGHIWSRPWWAAKRLFRQALVLQTYPNPPNRSVGCAELHALARMAHRERRIRRARKLNLNALTLARRTWSLRSNVIQDLLIVRVAIDMSRGRLEAALRRLTRIIRRANANGPSGRLTVINAVALQAEILRRAARDRQIAAGLLEHVVVRQAEEFTQAVHAKWSPYEAALARRGIENLHAFVDALLPVAGNDSDARGRLFARVAASKDLALRTLRVARGAAAAQLKADTIASGLAARLPAHSAYLEIFRWMPRHEGFTGIEWDREPKRYIAFAVRAGSSDVSLVDLGVAGDIDNRIKALLERCGEGTRSSERLKDELSALLEPRIAGARTVFIAPDGLFQAFPFTLLFNRERGAVPRTVVLVESAARLAESPNVERGPTSTMRSCVVCAPDCGGREVPYETLRGALNEAQDVGKILEAPVRVLPRDRGARGELQTILISHDLIHYAGHADFFEPPTSAKPFKLSLRVDQEAALLSSDDDFERARLILGGFNDWIDADPTIQTPDDVSISARDLASFDLTRVRLLTIAACHGARGADRPLEAPASLATAARVAGAGAVVAALWPISDRDTVLLMSAFYKSWRLHSSAAGALAQAQCALRDLGIDASTWGAFVVWTDISDVRRLRP